MAGGRESLRNGSTQALCPGQAASGWRNREHGGDAVVTDDAGNLLGQRPLVGQVWAPARRGDRQAAVRFLKRGTNLGQGRANLIARVVQTDQAGDESGGQVDRHSIRGCVVKRTEVVGHSPGEFDQQLHDASRRDDGHGRVNSALETFRRFAR